MNNLNRNAARLGPLLAHLAQLYRHRSEDLPPALRNAGGLRERHIGILITLAMGGGQSVSELAQSREMTVAHASLVVGELANAGLVIREHDPADRRRIIVSLSAKAAPAVDEMRRRNAGPVLSFLQELGEERADEFIANLAALVSRLEARQSAVQEQAGA